MKPEEKFEKSDGILDLTDAEQIADTTIISTSSLDLSGEITSKQTTKEVYDLSADKFWSLILGIHIPPEQYTPHRMK